MPKELEAQLKAEAEGKFPGDIERQNAYVYGTLRKIKSDNHWYWRPRGKKKAERSEADK